LRPTLPQVGNLREGGCPAAWLEAAGLVFSPKLDAGVQVSARWTPKRSVAGVVGNWPTVTWFAAGVQLCYTIAVTDLIVPAQWTHLNDEDVRGTVMVIGASDTGKSTLACYLFQELGRRGLWAAYLDTDVGQSCLGLPTTLNLALAVQPGDDRFPPGGPQVSYFVGSTTPRGHMLPAVVGAYRLQQKALALGAQAIVVDTTGLVDTAQGGKALKQWKIELLAPRVVIGLQRGRELEPILWPLRRDARVQSLELPVSPHAVERSREARIGHRRERLARYFEPARPRLVSLKQFAVYDVERLAVGALLAFQDAEGFGLDLGVVEEVDRPGGSLIARTPLESLARVSSLRFGTTRWDMAHQCEL
jgi:polynucleotide 5'-hydroxyl-kinase GRC3/NOL9